MLVALEHSGGFLRLATGPNNVTYGGYTFTASGEALQIGEVVNQVDLAASGISMELTGIPSNLLDRAILEDITNRKVEIIQVWFDSNWAFPAGYKAWIGYADGYVHSDDGEYTSLRLNAENRLTEAQVSTKRRWTNDDQKSIRNSSDTFFASVEAVQEFDLGAWGQG